MEMKRMDFDVHSIVGRKSYDCDILFRITDIKEENGEKIAILFGEDYRLIADAPLSDLTEIEPEDRHKMEREFHSKEEESLALIHQDMELLKRKKEWESPNSYHPSSSYFQIPGKVLHIDGDSQYLKKCLNLYQKIGVPVYGVHCDEKEMPHMAVRLVERYRPDLLVITGHDAYSKNAGKESDLYAYRHSRYFVKTVKEVRKQMPHLDQLVIFAGACQSHFEALIQAGANYASSPSRVNIHALDPVYIVSKICFTSFNESVNVWDILRNTLTGEKGIGGIETKGVLRTGMPYKSLQEDST
jgi:spore coat assembly protein